MMSRIDQSLGRRLECPFYSCLMLQRVSRRALLTSLCLLLLFVGLIIFTKGFLQVRPTFKDKSYSHDPPVQPLYFKNDQGGWLQARRRKIIMIVLDAFRIDLALRPAKGYQSPHAHIDLLTRLALEQPSRARLFHYLAEAPTVTKQRLMGITAGIIPAFSQAIENFSEASFPTDNFVYQFLHGDKPLKMNFYGEYTWIYLYPFISTRGGGEIDGHGGLDLFDLHTVDTAIKEKLTPALIKNDFDVLIAHFLGFDHCGHKYGLATIPCNDKIKEYERMIEETIKHMDEDALLLVLSDHGATDNGDHGGISEHETASLLFSYTKRPSSQGYELDFEQYWKRLFLRINEMRSPLDPKLPPLYFHRTCELDALHGSVPHVDFASTLSLLGNRPLPFSNLGSMIPELLLDHQLYEEMSVEEARRANLQYLLDAARMNSHQLVRYLKVTRKILSQVTEKQLFDQLIHRLGEIDNSIKGLDHESVEEIERAFFKYYEFLTGSQKAIRKIWTSFNYNQMVLGLVIGWMALLVAFLFNLPSDLLDYVFMVPVIFHIASLPGVIAIRNEDIYVGFFLATTVGIKLLCRILAGDVDLKRGMLTLLLIRCSLFIGSPLEEAMNYPFSHSNFSWQSSTLSSVAILIVGLVGMALTLGRFRRLPKLCFCLCLVASTLLMSLWIRNWVVETDDYSQFELATDYLFMVLIPRALLLLSIAIFYTMFKRRDFKGAMFGVGVLVGTVLRPFSGWSLIVLGYNLVVLGSDLFQGDDMASAAYCLFLTLTLYFSTGHQMTIPSLQWEAAFIGIRQMIPSIGGTLVTLNTLAGPILATGSLLLFVRYQALASSRSLLYLLLGLLGQTLMAATSSAMHCHHLMLWDVFAPRFIFQFLIMLFNLLSIVPVLFFIRE